MYPPLLLGRPHIRHAEQQSARAGSFAQRRPSDARARMAINPEYVQSVPGLGALVVSPDDSHLMTVAPTGAGKGRDVIIPNLLTYEGSVVVLDPKGENYDVTHRYRRDVLGHDIVLLDPFGASGSAAADRGGLNPFEVHSKLQSELSNELEGETAGDFGRLLADILGGGLKSLPDPFWDEMAQLLLATLTSDMLRSDSERPKSIRELRARLFGDVRYDMAVALDTREGTMSPFTAQEFKMLLSIDADKTFPGILATAAQQLAPFGSESAVAATDVTTFDLAALLDPAKRISLYIVLPPHKLRTHQRLLRAWVGSILYYVMNRHSPEAKLLFLIDEAAQLGRFSLLEEAITLLRGYGMRIWTFWQDLAQIETLYEKAASTMINNSGVLQVFGPTNFGSAATLSNRIGCSIGDLLLLGRDEQIVAFRSEWPARLARANYVTDPLLKGRAQPNPRHPE